LWSDPVAPQLIGRAKVSANANNNSPALECFEIDQRSSKLAKLKLHFFETNFLSFLTLLLTTNSRQRKQ